MKYRIFAALLLTVVAVVGVKATNVPLLNNIKAYEHTTLNGEWNYIVDVQEEGYYDYRMNPTPWGFFRNAKPQRPEDLVEYDFDKSPTMHIPSDWNTQDERLFFYEGTVWFKKTFHVSINNEKLVISNYDNQTSADPANKSNHNYSLLITNYSLNRVLLYFGAANYDCRVWVNGKEAGHHVGGFTPFNMDVSDLLVEGENTVIVKVDNKRHAEDVPTLIFDWWNYGGITRDVLLVKMPKTYIEDYSLRIAPEVGGFPTNTKAKSCDINFTAQLNKQEAGHKVVVYIPELKLEQQLTTDSEGKVITKFKVQSSKLKLWSPESPKLYQVHLSLDTATFVDSIGFRTIETRGKEILLNGKPIFLKGISIHNEKPNGGGRANSVEDARTLLGWAKELGCNFVRLAHYPHHEEMVREAERMGILVWSEIPVYWTIAWNNPKTYDNARQQLTDMIRRDHNRANIIIWSIANETPHSKERDTFLGNLAKYARTLDDSRLISMAMEVTGASNYVNRLNDNMNQYVDVVSFNQYVGWYRDVTDAPKMRWEIPYDKPVIISEFGGGARYGLHGQKNQRWTEEFQENLYVENIAMIDKIEGLAGTTPWILKDFRSPRRVLPGIQDYYNRKGLVSDKGEKKKAFYVLRDWYQKK